MSVAIARREIALSAARDGGFIVIDPYGGLGGGPFGHRVECLFAGSLADCLEYIRKAMAPPPATGSND